MPAQPQTLLEDLQRRMAKFEEQIKENTDKGNGVMARLVFMREVLVLEVNDSLFRMGGRIVQRYKDAIRQAHAGKSDAESLASLPSPIGFEKLDLDQYQAPGGKPAVANKPGPSPKPSTAGQPAPPQAQPQPSSNAPAKKMFVDPQLQLLLQRQLQLKKAALEAKEKGDIAGAKQFLLKAHQMDRMVQAAKGGLPVDIPNIPLAPQSVSGRSQGSSRSTAIGMGVINHCAD